MVGTPAYLRLDQYTSPFEAVRQAMDSYLSGCVDHTVAGLGITGSGREFYRAVLGADIVQTEIFAHAVGAAYLVAHFGLPDTMAVNPSPTALTHGKTATISAPDENQLRSDLQQVGSVIEIGGQDAKLILFGPDALPIYFNMNTICSAGTGEFLKQLADEAGISLDEFGALALQSTAPAIIDATCTVFSKRDFRHLTQKGVSLPDRLMGVCQALVRNYIHNVAGEHRLRPPVIFQGGVAHNAAVQRAFADQLGMPVYVLPYHDVVGALGMALATRKHFCAQPQTKCRFQADYRTRELRTQIRYCHGCPNGCDLAQPVEVRSNSLVVLATLGGRCDGCQKPANVHEMPLPQQQMRMPVVRRSKSPAPLDLLYQGQRPQRASSGQYFAGLDGGSRGTKYVLIQSLQTRGAASHAHGDDIRILAAGTIDTAGDAIQAVLQALERLRYALPAGSSLAGVGTTGSAGELFRDILTTKVSHTADHRCTEIVAHYVWASYWQPQVGTVMDIGGNDAKLITVNAQSLDFAMNDKCAAGTGSFLEAVARRFGLNVDEYAAVALQSDNPARIAGRCAVFGESDIIHKSRLGFTTPDLLLGLAYAVCRTYLSDVARGKPLRLPIVAQGGAFLNAAVQHAFRDTLALTPDEFIVAENSAYVLCAGALGAALCAKSRWELGYDSHFKGFATISKRTYETVSATCRMAACHRTCAGVIALLEDGVPIAGYRAVNCAFGHFGGMVTTAQEREHILQTLAPYQERKVGG
jgi:predicted CoA-substrate-specific enzyme activase